MLNTPDPEQYIYSYNNTLLATLNIEELDDINDYNFYMDIFLTNHRANRVQNVSSVHCYGDFVVWTTFEEIPETDKRIILTALVCGIILSPIIIIKILIYFCAIKTKINQNKNNG